MATYVAALCLAAVLLGLGLVASGYGIDSVPIFVALAVLGALAERASVRLSSTVEVSISSLPMLFAAVALGPVEAMVIGAVSQLGDFRPPYLKWAIYTPADAINGGLTGLVAAQVSQAAGDGLGAIAVATAAAVVTHQIIGVCFSALTVQLRGSGSGWGVIQTLAPVMPPSVLLWVAVLAPLAVAYDALSPWAVVLFLFPALAAQRLFVLYQQQRHLARDLSEANKSLERANLSFASALVTTLDARDRYTAGHSAAVAVYSRDVAQRLGLPSATQQLAHLSGLLHDIGKIGVPPGVLEKNGPLTLQERQKMEEHSVIGERILANVEAYAEIARIVRHHHERLDGQGYPDGLSGEEIPLISRIICVADAYNAMTSDRPYRDAMPVATARSRLLQAAGTQFDGEVVAAFDELLEHASDTYSSGARADFALEAQAHPELSSNLEVSAA
jgi:putative nucleotidyltransferase with HDIG domain